VIIPVVLEDGYKFMVAVMKFQHHRDYWMFCTLPIEAQPEESMFPNLAKAVRLLGTCHLTMAGDEDGNITAQFVR
jgi:hypothetical protein